MKVEFIITVESDEELPDNDQCDQIADHLEDKLTQRTLRLVGGVAWSSAWRKTL